MTAKKEAAEAEVKAVATSQKTTNKPVIYLGPSFKGVVQGTVYSNGLTPALSEAMERVPAIQGLVVSVSYAAKMLAEIEKPGTAAYRLYQAAKEYKGGTE